MFDVALLRKRVRAEIDQARRTDSERRERAKHATREYEAFLETVATPTFRQLAGVLRAEGILCDVQTPSGGVRLVADRNRDNVIELELDTRNDPPQPVLRTRRSWGSRVESSEQPVREKTAIGLITEEDVLARVLEEVQPWLT